MRLAAIVQILIALTACSIDRTRTLAMERLPDNPCSIAGVKAVIAGLSTADTRPLDIGGAFQGSMRTYVHAKVRDGVEVLLVTDMSQDDKQMLMVSFIGAREPDFLPERLRSVRQIARDCSR
ncbi:hypothetical protein M0208_01200 [Sphingomonas sp. SUN019]|uniref:hypothetical protein n=1 Tax=Sphingomonas sp. SUN019 TaxID=2937788 RepID=UPI0021642952|nr:hypothetical protein [Sphingomonas sp. SUN019]UVO49201.1 hypothetical protein M0208_01200 [Sphingomonas sp. SUN019]